MDAFHRICGAADSIAAFAVVVDAKDAAAVKFYKRFGFIQFADREQSLFLEIAKLRKELEGA
jgi:hypothetical protein